MPGDEFRPSPSLVSALAGAPIHVGTRNPAKLAAVRAAFESFRATDGLLDLVPIDVGSGVPEQPIGFDQILRGARNRARAAFATGDAALAVGIEDGLARFAGGGEGADSAAMEAENRDAGPAVPFYNVGCAWLTDGDCEGHGFSAAFAYPVACRVPAVRDQLPIGDLFDDLWRSVRGESHQSDSKSPVGSADSAGERPAKPSPSGRQGGNIGMLTGGRLERADYGAQAVVCALVRFLHTDLYD